jgi:FkbM family methyltransferase
MKIGQRNFGSGIKAFFESRHYVALLNMIWLYPDFWEALKRYISDSGPYPYDISIRTPIGVISPRIYNYYNMRTVNEIFCRGDYHSGRHLNVVVDIGSNLGISALYFLTRNKQCRCYLFEPLADNAEKLRYNLRGFEGRYFLEQKAVSDSRGVRNFGIEFSGARGGLDLETGRSIMVPCVHINDILADILGKEEYIDILKIDIEKGEIGLIKAIEARFFAKIKLIYFEFHERNRALLKALMSEGRCLRKHRSDVYAFSSC